jgi:hypothetical protein
MPAILYGVYHILDNAEHVKAGENQLGEIHILLEWNRRVVLTMDWICCSDDGTAFLKRGDDTGLGKPE